MNNIPGSRAEVVRSDSSPNPERWWFADGDEVWYHWFTMFPSNLTIPRSWHIWTQWHFVGTDPTCPSPNGSVPCHGDPNPLQFNFRSDPIPGSNRDVETMELRVINKENVWNGASDPTTIIWSAPLQKGIWYATMWSIRSNWKMYG